MWLQHSRHWAARLRAAALISYLACFTVGCASRDNSAAATASQPTDSTTAVRFVAANRRTVEEGLDLPAKVQPDPTRLVHIFPPASGRLISMEVKPGDHVRAGQTLATLQSADVAGARADFFKAQTETGRARRVLEREQTLYDHGAAPEKDLIEARAAADSAQAELDRARQRLALLGSSPQSQSDRIQLAAPIAAVVLDISAAPGEFSKSLDNANPLITLADLSSVWVVADLYEKDVARVRPAKPAIVTLQAYPGRQWKARIASVSDALDPTSRTLKVRVVLPNPQRELKPEMFGSVHVSAGTREALLVPAAAVLREGERASVFVRKDGQLEQRSVIVGATFGSEVEITSGLRPGEQVAAEGAELLKGAPQ